MRVQSSGWLNPPQNLFQPEPTLWVQNFFGPAFEYWFRAVSELGTTWGVAFAVGLALWVWGRRDAYALVGMTIVSGGSSVLMNLLFNVPRPDHPAIVKYEQIDLGSFPSGHVFLATVVWGVLYVRGCVNGWILALVFVGVSMSRLFLGVHYLIDVYGGTLFALMVVGAYQPLWKRLEVRLENLSFGFFRAAGVIVIIAAVAAAIAGMYGTNQFQWYSAGLAVGGSIALLLEHRFVRYEPPSVGVLGVLARLALGLAGLGPLVVLDHVRGEGAYALGAVLVAIGALWATLAVPAILRQAEEGIVRRPKARPQELS